MLVLNKAEGLTVVSISSTTLPALVRSTHPDAGFFFPRSNASFLGSSHLTDIFAGETPRLLTIL